MANASLSRYVVITSRVHGETVTQFTTGAQTRDQLRQAFIASPEFQGRVSAMLAAGCLP